MINLNEYFDGAVKSLAYENQGRSTVGVIDTGEYEFGTSSAETMHIIEGELLALLPGEKTWQHFQAGDKFEIDANLSFKVKVKTATSYLCKYN